APASAPALPAGPDHVHSVRSRPGAAGCAVHSSDTRVPSTPEIAHSTCGHTAVGDEWTKITPRVLTADLRCRRGTSSPTSSRHGELHRAPVTGLNGGTGPGRPAPATPPARPATPHATR